jgi:hypothetical protein
MPCLVPYHPQVRNSKRRQVRKGSSSKAKFPSRQRQATNHTISSSARFYTGNGQSQLPVFRDNTHWCQSQCHPSIPFGQVCSASAAPALTPCLKWVRRIHQRRLPLRTSLHSSLLISPTLSWTRISLPRDLILNLVRLSLLPYLQLHLHLFQIVPLSFFYDQSLGSSDSVNLVVRSFAIDRR